MKKRPVVAIIGASGLIGTALLEIGDLHENFSVVGTGFSHLSTALHSLDITDSRSMRYFMLKHRPDILVWLAGTKDLKRCESNPCFATRLNVEPLGKALDLLRSENLHPRIIFFSSDYVFDGIRGKYRDDALVDPQTMYGRSKVKAEGLLAAWGGNYTVVRTSAVMGRGANFFDWLVEALMCEQPVELFTDVNFSPTSLHWLSRQVVSLMRSYENVPKIVHIAGMNHMSRYEFGCLVAKALGKEQSLLIPVEVLSSGTLWQPNLTLVASEAFLSSANPREWIREELAL